MKKSTNRREEMQDKNAQTLADLKNAIREAHGLLKDIRLEHLEIKKTLTNWKEELDAEMTEYIKKEFNALSDELQNHLKKVESSINKRFDTLTKNILGYASQGPLSIEEHAQMTALVKRYGQYDMR